MTHYTVFVYTKYTEEEVDMKRFDTYPEAADFVLASINTGSHYAVISLE